MIQNRIQELQEMTRQRDQWKASAQHQLAQRGHAVARGDRLRLERDRLALGLAAWEVWAEAGGPRSAVQDSERSERELVGELEEPPGEPARVVGLVELLRRWFLRRR